MDLTFTDQVDRDIKKLEAYIKALKKLEEGPDGVPDTSAIHLSKYVGVLAWKILKTIRCVSSTMRASQFLTTRAK